MIIGNSKGVNDRHIQFGSITSSGKGYNGHCTYMASHRKCIVKVLIGSKYYVKHLNKKILKLVGQAVRQISRSCVIASMSY